MSNVWGAGAVQDVSSISMLGVRQFESAGFKSLYSAPAGSQTAAMRAAGQRVPAEDLVEQASMEAFAQGFDEGCRVTAEAMTSEGDARNRLVEALELLAPAPSGTLATMLSAAVIRLVGQIVGEVEVDAGVLLERCEAVAGFIDQSEGKSALHLHPDDLPLLDGADVGVALVADATLKRGCVRLDTADGWVEDGPDVRLSRLRAMLDDMEGKA